MAVESPTASKPAPIAPKPSAAVGVATPTPSPISDAPTSAGFSQVASYSSMSLTPGAPLGPRYRIEALLGEGGMGAVYKAYDKDLDRTVALKLVRPELTVDPGAMQRFKQELLLASKISHKNILRIHDLGDVNGMKFISMAYVEGEDLHQVLKKGGKLAVDRAVRIARQLAAALEAAHNEGVVHRDLKPQNILIDKADSAYVSDFGLAKSLESDSAGMTRTGQVLGTPRYMSPEQVEAKPADHRSDLYSLGLIFYEMVTGVVPFAGDSAMQVMFQRLKEKPKNPKQLNPELPDYMARLIMKCLEKNPAQRYQSAGEVLADLEAERAPSLSFTRSVQITVPVVPSRPWLIAMGSVLALAALVFAIPGVRHRVFRPPAATGENAPPQAPQKYLAVLPFRVVGDPAALGYVADGLVEALSAKLFQLKNVHVASAAEVEKASQKGSLDRKGSLEKIAHELGANLIVQGTLQGTRDKIRVVMDLEDVGGGKRLWTQEFSGVPQDLLTLEDQIYGKLVDALELKLNTEEMARGTAHPTENIDAYDLYLKGRAAMRQRQNVKNVEAAIRHFEDALRKDSSFALAYAGLAAASLAMYQEKKDSVWADKALNAAEQGQRLNDNLPEVHFALGSGYGFTGKSAEAVVELKRALELAPNSDEGYRRLGEAYRSMGRKEESIRAYERAAQINPYYWENYNELATAYYQFGDNEKAVSTFRRVTEVEPDNPAGWVNLGTAYFQVGKWDECITAYQKALQLQPDYLTYSNLGSAYFYLKRYDEAARMFEKAVEMNPNEQLAAGNLAAAYYWTGQKEKALAEYDKAIGLALKELQVNPRNATSMGYLGLYYAKKGDSARALDFIHRARSIDPSDNTLMYDEAIVDALTGRSNEAVPALRQALQKGIPPQQALNEPDLKSVQALPEFDKLLKEFSGKKQ